MDPLQAIMSLLQAPQPRRPVSVRPDYGLTGAQVLQTQKSPYERTLRPGETRSAEDLQGMLAEVLMAAGSGALPGVGPRGQARQTPARVRPGFEKQFKEWFGGSKAATKEGKPLDLFHGTQEPGFREFSKEKASPGLYGKGFYLTSDPSVASEYSGIRNAQRPGVLPVHASIKNPIDMESPVSSGAVGAALESLRQQRGIDPGSIFAPRFQKKAEALLKKASAGKLTGRDLYHELDAINFGSSERLGKSSVNQALRDAGFDGITHLGGQIMGNKDHRVWIAFEPTQIKSATGNRGTYDPNSPRIDE